MNNTWMMPRCSQPDEETSMPNLHDAFFNAAFDANNAVLDAEDRSHRLARQRSHLERIARLHGATIERITIGIAQPPP